MLIRLFLVDDHRVVVEGLRTLLAEEESICIVGAAETGREAVDSIVQHTPDVVLLDLKLPDLSAATVIERSRAAGVTSHFVIFTAYTDRVYSGFITQIGASGCLLKDASAPRLVNAIHNVLRGDIVVDMRIEESVDQPGPVLSQRELEVLQRCALGETNAEIADQLHLAPNTVKSYLQSVMQKLGARNRVHAIAVARAQRLL